MPVFLVTSLGLSIWLMWHTFSYDPHSGSMMISGKVWSDFGWMIPLIRSFSRGENWPPQNPFFPGEPVKYHILFHLATGFLEKIGLRIDWAFNLLSALGFFGLLVMLFVFSKKVFNKTSVALLAVILFLFNGSLSFVEYFNQNGWTTQAIRKIVINSEYPSFGPWDGSSIAAIWNLNLYTNQRPLGMSIALLLVLVYLLCYRHTHPVFMGIFGGLLLFINQGVFPAWVLFLAWGFFLSKDDRKYIFWSSLSLLPWIIISFKLINTSGITFDPGFLLVDPLTITSLTKYWFANLGLHIFLIPLGFAFAPRKIKPLALPLLSIFLVPNIFRLTVDIFNNHKLINVFMIFGVIFSSWALNTLWQKKLLRPLVILMFFAVTFSGVIDFFALKNDTKISVKDLPQNSDAQFVYTTIPPRAIVLNSTWFFHPASLAGRPIFSGYTYFTWAHGYDSHAREEIQKSIYAAQEKTQACQLLENNNISFVELNDSPEEFLQPNVFLWQTAFMPIYRNDVTGITFYDVEKSCRN